MVPNLITKCCEIQMFFITKIYTNYYVYFPASVGDLKPNNTRFIYLIFVVIEKKKRQSGLFSLRIDDVINMCDVLLSLLWTFIEV